MQAHSGSSSFTMDNVKVQVPVARPGSTGRKPASVATNFIAGGGAGMMDALICYPLDTIKVRMQLARQNAASSAPVRGFVGTGMDIVRQGSVLDLYRGLGAVTAGIMPKIALRFMCYDWYRQLLGNKDRFSFSPTYATLLAGLAAGFTEAIAVVTPMEVVKIRLQAQYHSPAGSSSQLAPKYRNAAHAFQTILREEGPGGLWRGVSLTAVRQGTNVAANFVAYEELKNLAHRNSPDPTAALPSHTVALIGLIAGAVGPLCNAPIDTMKTRLQKTPTATELRQSALTRTVSIASNILRREGIGAFWAGIVPRVARVAPGQAVTFAAYEFIRKKLEDR